MLFSWRRWVYPGSSGGQRHPGQVCWGGGQWPSEVGMDPSGVQGNQVVGRVSVSIPHQGRWEALLSAGCPGVSEVSSELAGGWGRLWLECRALGSLPCGSLHSIAWRVRSRPLPVGPTASARGGTPGEWLLFSRSSLAGSGRTSWLISSQAAPWRCWDGNGARDSEI